MQLTADDAQNKNGEDGQVLPVDTVIHLTESLGTLSVAAQSGVKVVLLPESVNSERKMKHVPAQGHSRGPRELLLQFTQLLSRCHNIKRIDTASRTMSLLTLQHKLQDHKREF